MFYYLGNLLSWQKMLEILALLIFKGPWKSVFTQGQFNGLPTVKTLILPSKWEGDVAREKRIVRTARIQILPSEVHLYRQKGMWNRQNRNPLNYPSQKLTSIDP